MAQIRIDRKEDFEKAFRKFNAKIKKEGILKEVRARRHYLKPSAVKRAARSS